MQIIALDILGPLPNTGNGNCYVLVATDYYTMQMGGSICPSRMIWSASNFGPAGPKKAA